MARYIDVDKHSFPTLHQKELNDYMKGWNTCLKSVLQQPTADYAEVKHGYWIYHFDDLFPSESTQECSVCHEEEGMTICNENYCPNCGAKMDGSDKK